MANAWTPKDVKLGSLTPITTDTTTLISKPFGITAGGAARCKVAVKVSGRNGLGTATIHLESAVSAAEAFSSFVTETVTASTDGWYYLDFISSSTSLLDVARITVVTASSAQLTVDEVKFFQED